MQPNDPLFPASHTQTGSDGFVLGRPNSPESASNPTEAAVNIIRDKVARAYAEEPNAAAEEKQAAAAHPRSKHQQFMYDLQTSGRSLADIQAAWHAYYQTLPAEEKHAVWREFYQANSAPIQQHAPQPTPAPAPPVYRQAKPVLSQAYAHELRRAGLTALGTLKRLQAKAPLPRPTVPALSRQTMQEIKQRILRTVNADGRLRIRHHAQSLSFGLAVGLVTLFITLFSFFNEVIIAPFIQPARTVGATPIIIDPASTVATSTPEIIIPKINLEIPVDYNETSDNEDAIQQGLETGVVHYPSTVMPGQSGNATFFGHSSNNIFNPGKYKFAFVLLHELVPGDTFYLTQNGRTYVYKVFSHTVVPPTDVGVLNPTPGHPATATLITCDPPGTALNRLVIVGDQISPDPGVDATPTAPPVATTATVLPDNGPSLWDRIWHSIF